MRLLTGHTPVSVKQGSTLCPCCSLGFASGLWPNRRQEVSVSSFFNGKRGARQSQWHAFEGAERGRSHLVAWPFIGLRCCSTVMEAPRFEGKGSCPETDDEGYHIGNGYIVPVLGRLLLSLDDAT